MTNSTAKPTTSYWIVSVLLLLWALAGVASYLMDVRMTAADLAALPAAQQQVYASRPEWVVYCYAVAVWSALLAAIGLLIRKAWAVTLYLISLIAVAGQEIWTVLLSGIGEILGYSALIVPVVILLLAIFSVSFARASKVKGLLA